MWDAPFDESMLNLKQGVAILCKEEHLAEELFEFFKANGTAKNWENEERGTKWKDYGEDTVYCVLGENVMYGTKDSVESISPYKNYKRFTFNGFKEQDFEAANDDELMKFLGIGGV